MDGRPKTWLVVALVAAAVVCAGCSSSGGASRTSSAPTTTSAARGRAGDREFAISIGAPPIPGTLVVPAGRGPFPAIVFVSGSGPNDRDETIGPNHPLRDLASGLAARGIATLRYDKRTKVYPRAVDVSTFTPTQEYVPDAVAAVRLLHTRADIDARRIVVLGHSQGGTFAPRIAVAAPVAGVILLAAAAAPFGATIARQTGYLARSQPPSSALTAQLAALRREAALIDDPNLAPNTPAASLLGGLGPQYWRDLSGYDAVATARSLSAPILLLQGDRDYQVTVADDLRRWERGLAGHAGITEHRYAADDHLFFTGTGSSEPNEYLAPHTVDPAVVRDIAKWMSTLR
jgi:uncharacterized protein